MYKLVTYLLFYFILFLEWWNETIFIGIKTFVWSIRASEKQYFDSQNKKEIKWNKRQQITDLISDLNLTFVLVPFGVLEGWIENNIVSPRHFVSKKKETKTSKTNKSNIKEISDEFLLENTPVLLWQSKRTHITAQLQTKFSMILQAMIGVVL